MTSPVVWFALALFFGTPQTPPQQNAPAPAKQEKPPAAQEKATPTQEKAPAKTESKAPAKKPKRVFTNDEVESPAERARPRHKEESEETAESKPAKTKAKDGATPARPEETEEYYSEKMMPLRSDLSQVESELSSARYKPEYDPQTGRPIISHSKQNEIERLERRRGDLHKKIGAVCEEAGRNNVWVRGC